jgi:hypothetical protein
VTEHLDIQDPDDFTPEDLMCMAEHLFAPLTPVEELERICMTLAHLPTQGAQDLLARFQASPRAGEVTWLECAVEEGAYLLLGPTSPLEEREYLTLKVIQELTDEVTDLEVERNQRSLSRDKGEIRLSALQALADAGKVHPDQVRGYGCGIQCDTERIAELDQEIELKEAMIAHLRGSITTPRYRQADPDFMRHVHWDA